MMAAAQPAASSSNYMYFEVGDCRFCAPVDEVESIIEVDKVHTLPFSPKGVAGVFLFRGHVAALCELAAVLDIARGPAAPKALAIVTSLAPGLIAFRVDHVSDVVNARDVKAQDTGEHTLQEWMDGYVMQGEAIAILTTFEKLLRLFSLGDTAAFAALVRQQAQLAQQAPARPMAAILEEVGARRSAEPGAAAAVVVAPGGAAPDEVLQVAQPGDSRAAPAAQVDGAGIPSDDRREADPVVTAGAEDRAPDVSRAGATLFTGGAAAIAAAQSEAGQDGLSLPAADADDAAQAAHASFQGEAEETAMLDASRSADVLSTGWNEARPAQGDTPEAGAVADGTLAAGSDVHALEGEPAGAKDGADVSSTGSERVDETTFAEDADSLAEVATFDAEPSVAVEAVPHGLEYRAGSGDEAPADAQWREAGDRAESTDPQAGAEYGTAEWLAPGADGVGSDASRGSDGFALAGASGAVQTAEFSALEDDSPALEAPVDDGRVGAATADGNRESMPAQTAEFSAFSSAGEDNPGSAEDDERLDAVHADAAATDEEAAGSGDRPADDAAWGAEAADDALDGGAASDHAGLDAPQPVEAEEESPGMAERTRQGDSIYGSARSTAWQSTPAHAEPQGAASAGGAVFTAEDEARYASATAGAATAVAKSDGRRRMVPAIAAVALLVVAIALTLLYATDGAPSRDRGAVQAGAGSERESAPVRETRAAGADESERSRASETQAATAPKSSPVAAPTQAPQPSRPIVPAGTAPVAPNVGKERAMAGVFGPDYEVSVERSKGPADPNAAPEPLAAGEIRHVVVKGDTLWRIARINLGDPYRYPELAQSNEIRNPDRIYPGDVVRIRKRK